MQGSLYRLLALAQTVTGVTTVTKLLNVTKNARPKEMAQPTTASLIYSNVTIMGDLEQLDVRW